MKENCNKSPEKLTSNKIVEIEKDSESVNNNNSINNYEDLNINTRIGLLLALNYFN